MKNGKPYAARHSSGLSTTIGSMLDPRERAVVNRAKVGARWKSQRHKEFAEMYEVMSQSPLSELLKVRDQVLADWNDVGEYESSLQLAVVECRIDKIRQITQSCGCPDPVPGHVRLDRPQARVA